MKYPSLLLLLFALSACNETAPLADAYGNFEATSTTVSAQANGQLLYINVAEGEVIPAGKLIGLVDTTQLHLQRLQLEAQLRTFGKQVRTAAPDIAVYEDQKRNLIRERDRTKRLVDAKAATSRQLDELNGQIEVIDQQIAAAQSKANEANRGILSGKDPIQAQIGVIDNQIAKAYIYNPVAGTVMTKLAESSEIVGMGSPLTASQTWIPSPSGPIRAACSCNAPASARKLTFLSMQEQMLTTSYRERLPGYLTGQNLRQRPSRPRKNAPTWCTPSRWPFQIQKVA